MQTREELINRLRKTDIVGTDDWCETTLKTLIEFILEDRKRIVAPLVNHNEMLEHKLGGKREIVPLRIYQLTAERNGLDAISAIDECLRLAGL